MIRPAREDRANNEPSWTLRFREALSPRVIGLFIPAISAAILFGFVATGNFQKLDFRRPVKGTQATTVDKQTVNSIVPTAAVLNATSPPSTSPIPASVQDYTAQLPSLTVALGDESTPAVVCNQTLKSVATNIYQSALATEDAVHQIKLDNLLKSLLSTLGLQQENERHDSRLRQLNIDLQTALGQANC